MTVQAVHAYPANIINCNLSPSTMYHVSTLGLTSDGNSICEFVKNATKTNGDDAAECYEYH